MLFVNFDREILQLIREAKQLQRMGIEIPESARMVLLQVRDVFLSTRYCNRLLLSGHSSCPGISASIFVMLMIYAAGRKIQILF
jgi:hypothetical protein